MVASPESAKHRSRHTSSIFRHWGSEGTGDRLPPREHRTEDRLRRRRHRALPRS